jgi:RNA polymerase sigma factor (sigma-70 family)
MMTHPYVADQLVREHNRQMLADASRRRILRRRATGNASTQAIADSRSVTALVIRTRNGDEHAWDELFERYAPLIRSICRSYRLRQVDVDDIGQNVWLKLVDHIAAIRDPAALPGWLVTTTRRECCQVLRAARQQQASGPWPDVADMPDTVTGMVESELLRAERSAALREALTQLPSLSRRLIAMLIQDPPAPYTEISAQLGIPVGSIGPYRARLLEKLRRYPALAALINA